MMVDLRRRRDFLRAAAAAGAVWATADIVHVEEALGWAQHQMAAGGESKLSVLTPDEAEAIVAMTSRILPSVEGRPGAREAGVVYFIDRSLSTFNAAHRRTYADGVKDLNRRAADRWKGVANFAALAPAQQDELLRDIEQTPFFKAARFDTIVGMFALPKWGGNRDFAGWRMLGMTHQAKYEPPFGFYDADVNKRS